jgi:hypothetical protein
MKRFLLLLEILLFVIAFLVVQMGTMFIVSGLQICIAAGTESNDLANQIKVILSGSLIPDATGLIISSIVSSVLILLMFLSLRWTPVSPTYLRTRPWTVFAWVVVLTLGTIIPSTWLGEQIPYDMPEDLEAMLVHMMHSRWGYLAIGILAPLAEEVVFRGAVLRVLLKVFDERWYWIPIILSAMIFGAVHGNVQQFIHATLIGLILGWMYYRTRSILPGILFHWVNNSVAYVISNLMPGAEDAQLVDIFGGDQQAVWLSLIFSCCLMLPALFQLYLHMKKA